MAENGGQVDKSVPAGQTQPKVVTAVAADPDRRVLVLKARGPLDVSDTMVHLSYALLKSLAGQMMEQEGTLEAQQIAAAHGIITPPH